MLGPPLKRSVSLAVCKRSSAFHTDSLYVYVFSRTIDDNDANSQRIRAIMLIIILTDYSAMWAPTEARGEDSLKAYPNKTCRIGNTADTADKELRPAFHSAHIGFKLLQCVLSAIAGSPKSARWQGRDLGNVTTSSLFNGADNSPSPVYFWYR